MTEESTTQKRELSAHKLAELCAYYGAAQKIKELSTCIELIRKQPTPHRVMEIGTDRGGTFWLWCQLAHEKAQIISLDLPMKRFSSEKGYNEKILRSYAQPGQQLAFIRKNSHSDKAESQVRELLENQPLDLLFIDGDHTYEGVKEDYTRFSKYVRKGGIILFHDIIVHDQILDCQVNRFWNEIKQEHEAHEFIDPEPDDRGWGSWGGLGMILKN